MKNYEKHEYNIMPKMADEQYNAIVYDMKNNGYKENQPVILYQNKIIDGWHRYKAAQDAGVSASYETFSGSNSEALEEVRRRNERRDLTSSQRAAVAVSYEKYFNDIADAVKDERAKKQSETLKSTYESGSFGVAGKKFPETKNDDYKTRTAVKIAKQFNTNDNYIKQAKKIKNENPDFFKKIIDGDKNFQDYKNEIKQKNKADRIEKEQSYRGKKIADLDIRKGDFNDVLSDVYDIDAIITDPPYPYEFIDCWSDLAVYSKEHLKDDGFLVAYSGQYHLQEVIKRLSEHLTYVWTFCLSHQGKSQLVNGVNIMCGWKPVLIFSKGRKKMRFSAYDVILSESREKHSHEWQQSESGVLSLIESFTEPEQLIVDPFSGSGTFCKVAVDNGRKAIGAEIK